MLQRGMSPLAEGKRKNIAKVNEGAGVALESGRRQSLRHCLVSQSLELKLQHLPVPLKMHDQHILLPPFGLRALQPRTQRPLPSLPHHWLLQKNLPLLIPQFSTINMPYLLSGYNIINVRILRRGEAEASGVRAGSAREGSRRLRFQHLGYAVKDAGKDFSEYNKEFKLRTDAVWEKTQLKDWFRCANKVTPT